MDLTALQQKVNRVFSLIYAWIGFIPTFFSSTPQDVTVTWENEDGSTTTQTHPNLAKMKTSMHIHVENTDIDTLRTPGLYTSSTWINSPANGTYGSLSVLPTNGSATDVVQLFRANDGKVYQRFWNNATPGWPPHWVETVGVTAVSSGNPDDYKKAGRYHSSAWNTTPDGSTFGDLEVYYINGATNDVGQKYTSSADKVFVRFFNSASSTWTSWKRLWTNDAMSLNRPGYMKLPNGFIIQWGISGTVASGGTETITLPITFPNAPLVPAGSIAVGSGGNYGGVNIGLPDNSHIVVGHYNGGGNSAKIFWIVIGH